MKPERVIIAYFSPTGGTKKVAQALKDGLEAALTTAPTTAPTTALPALSTQAPVIKAPGLNIKLGARSSAPSAALTLRPTIPATTPDTPDPSAKPTPVTTVNCLTVKSRHKDLALGPRDLFVLVYPVYFGRMPWALQQWPALHGHGASALVVSVYGNRAIEDGERESMALLKEHGFKVVGAIEAIAEHSQERTLAQGRPDAQDAHDFKTMAAHIIATLTQGELPEYAFDVTTELKAPGKAPAVPRILERAQCDDCGRCARLCPMQIIDPQTLEVPEEKAALCMGCRACMACCKQQCRGFPQPILAAIAARMSQIKAANPERKPNVLKLSSEPSAAPNSAPTP